MPDKSLHLKSRAALFENMESFLEEHKKSGDILALLLINIDNFRRLNTVFGYKAGDELLTLFAQRINSFSREKDYIARMGNSEFLLVLPEIKNSGHASLAAHKVLRSLSEPFILDGKEHNISVNIGLSLFPEHSDSVSELIQKAEIALISARNSAEPFVVYSDEKKDITVYAWDIEGELDKAIENDELHLYYQPQISIQTGMLFGAEALLRWKNEERGFIRPDIFIPIAEKSGQIHEITWWTINTALRQVVEWPKPWRPLKVAVNISAKLLNDFSFVDAVRSALSVWEVSPKQLLLEITESALMEDYSRSMIALEELKSIGVGISLDDFGTGYSSMAYFKNIPADELKIDQSFVFHMLSNAMDQHVVNTVIELAHGFNLKVVAEGVENVETLEKLKELNCDIAQGFYVAKAMPQKEFIQWVNKFLNRG